MQLKMGNGLSLRLADIGKCNPGLAGQSSPYQACTFVSMFWPGSQYVGFHMASKTIVDLETRCSIIFKDHCAILLLGKDSSIVLPKTEASGYYLIWGLVVQASASNSRLLGWRIEVLIHFMERDIVLLMNFKLSLVTAGTFLDPLF